MIHTAKLDLEQFQDKPDSAELPIEFDVWSYWYSCGYPVDDIVDAYCAVHTKQDDEDSSHIILKVQTLSKPLDRADVISDSTTLWTCDCKAYAYHEKVDLEETPITEWGYCKHIESVEPSIKAQGDENQESLF